MTEPDNLDVARGCVYALIITLPVWCAILGGVLYITLK
jgi:hypothetical protein